VSNPKALERIKKLLRLARDPGASPAEAESAFLQAQRIMAENGFEDGEVIDTAAPEEAILDEDVTIGRRRDFWRGRLAVVVSRNFRCKTYWQGHPDGHSGIHFLGRRSDVAIAKEVYVAAQEVALQQAGAFRKANGGGLKSRNAFLSGFSEGLAAKFEEQVQRMTATGTALVVVADARVEAKFDELKLGRGKPRYVRLGDEDARVAGEQAGRAFDLRRDLLRA
jgi:hypothetical protein